MFVGKTDLFLGHKNLKTLYSLVNQELQKDKWFKVYKLSLDGGKTRYSLSHKSSRKATSSPAHLFAIRGRRKRGW